MRALVCHAPEDLRIENVELPTLGAHQVQVGVAFGGICGSDLHYFQHGGFGTVRIKQPMALGHEISGVIQALGDQVNTQWVNALPSRLPALAAIAAFAFWANKIIA
jgi:L-idonate 5-dehydrogenase